MNSESVESTFRKKISDAIRVLPEGTDRYRVFTPFRFDDGDHFAIVIKKIVGGWVLSDEGHTFMHLSYDLDLASIRRGTRAGIVAATMDDFHIREENGALITQLSDDNEESGDAFYNYLQGLCKIANLNFLTRERMLSTFADDLSAFIAKTVPAERWVKNHFVEKDYEQKYPIDYKINGMAKPVFVYGIGNDGKCRDATIYLHQFEKWEIPHRSIAVFENQEEIGRKVLARFSDICGKMFSSLGEENQERIGKHLTEIMGLSLR